MARIIKIVGDEVITTEEVEQKRISLDSFLANLENGFNFDSGILPRGCLRMRKNENSVLYAMELAQQIVRMKF